MLDIKFRVHCSSVLVGFCFFFGCSCVFKGAENIFMIRMGESESETKMFWMLCDFFK